MVTDYYDKCAEELIGKAVELLQTLAYADAKKKFMEDEESWRLAMACECALDAVWAMAVWAVMELVPIVGYGELQV